MQILIKVNKSLDTPTVYNILNIRELWNYEGYLIS